MMAYGKVRIEKTKGKAVRWGKTMLPVALSASSKRELWHLDHNNGSPTCTNKKGGTAILFMVGVCG